jgi:hypothetical protein
MLRCGRAEWLLISEAPNVWHSRPRQEISMTARKDAISPDRRKAEDSREKVDPVPATAIGSDVPAKTAPQPAGNVTAFPQTHSGGLSNRALNILKILAPELTGECPPRQNWTPSAALLRRVTFKHLATARNCGPQTIREISQWAASRGVTIQPPSLAGKSLSATWRELGAKFAAGELAPAEMAEALEKSIHRKSTTIPVAIQKILLQFVNKAGKQSPA